VEVLLQGCAEQAEPELAWQAATLCIPPATLCIPPATLCIPPATLCIPPATLCISLSSLGRYTSGPMLRVCCRTPRREPMRSTWRLRRCCRHLPGGAGGAREAGVAKEAGEGAMAGERAASMANGTSLANGARQAREAAGAAGAAGAAVPAGAVRGGLGLRPQCWSWSVRAPPTRKLWPRSYLSMRTPRDAPYATQGSNPSTSRPRTAIRTPHRAPALVLVDRVPHRSATHTCEPRLGQVLLSLP